MRCCTRPKQRSPVGGRRHRRPSEQAEVAPAVAAAAAGAGVLTDHDGTVAHDLSFRPWGGQRAPRVRDHLRRRRPAPVRRPRARVPVPGRTARRLGRGGLPRAGLRRARVRPLRRDAVPTRSPAGWLLTGAHRPETSVLRGAVCDYVRATEVAAAVGVPTLRAVSHGVSLAGGLALIAEAARRWGGDLCLDRGPLPGECLALRNQAARANSRGTSTGSASPTAAPRARPGQPPQHPPASVRSHRAAGLEVPVYSPYALYTHSSQLQHPLTPERRRPRGEHRPRRSGPEPRIVAAHRLLPARFSALTSAFRVSTAVDRLAHRWGPSRGAVRGMVRSTNHSTRACQTLFMAVTLSDTCRSSVVPPAGFEPALPPPETGRSRDRRRPPASYLGFLFASCVSGGLLCPVVRSTRHPTASVLIGREPSAVRGWRSQRSP